MYLPYDVKLQITLETIETSGFWRQRAERGVLYLSQKTLGVW